MLIGKNRHSENKESEVTDEGLFKTRREFIKRSGLYATGLALGGISAACSGQSESTVSSQVPAKRTSVNYAPGEELTSWENATSYNNFYEFGTDKEDPVKYAKAFKTSPWTVTVEGAAKKTGKFNLEDIIHSAQLEERIYRFRCVETWSMVVPWLGVSMASFLGQFEPDAGAKYVEFTTLYDPEQMPGQRRQVLQWPYVEGLRMDEAMHPLSMMVTGLYGKDLPNQNGAPLRMMVPWKYGFKNIKSIVKIRFLNHMPATTWALSAPAEYGFYANVNPQVSHPRWSQAKERRLGSYFKQETLMFNGYADDVASLYAGMDLKKNF